MSFTRRQLVTAAALVSAAAAKPAGAVRQTPGSDQPWPTVTLAEAGFDPGLGETIIASLPNFPAVTGVVVVRGGRLAFEHYLGGYDAGRLVNIRSTTKSVTSTLVGSPCSGETLPGSTSRLAKRSRIGSRTTPIPPWQTSPSATS
jgi:CubicO group peptidase (beta-lactamase class C family)